MILTMGRMGVGKKALFEDFYPEEIVEILRLAAEEFVVKYESDEPMEVSDGEFFMF